MSETTAGGATCRKCGRVGRSQFSSDAELGLYCSNFGACRSRQEADIAPYPIITKCENCEVLDCDACLLDGCECACRAQAECWVCEEAAPCACDRLRDAQKELRLI